MSGRKKYRTKKSYLGQNIRMILCVLLTLLAAAGLLLNALLDQEIGRMIRADIDFANVAVNSSVRENSPDTRGYRTIALVGVDSRDESEAGGNSDTMMILSIHKDTGEVRIASLYRDTYLRIGQGDYQKANAAYNRGGPELFLSMLNTNLDLNITDFVTVDFSVMIDMIDILGGIDMTLTADEVVMMNDYCQGTSEITGKPYEAIEPEVEGTYHLSGIQAVSYMRIRYGYGLEFRRTLRQRAVVLKMAEKMKSARLPTLYRLLDTLLPGIYTNLTKEEILPLALAVKKYTISDTTGFPFDHVMGEPAIAATGIDCVLPVTLETNAAKLHNFLYPDLPYTPSEELITYSDYITEITGYGEADIPESSADGGEMPS